MRVLRGRLVTGKVEYGQVELDESKIVYAGPVRPSIGDVTDYGDYYIAPGFIDIHIHGLAGHEAMDRDTESIKMISKRLAAKGVTGFLPTLQTAPIGEIIDALKRIKTVMGTEDGVRILGVHLEGPYINPERIGAQEEYVQKPTRNELQTVLDAGGDALRIVTLAPEVDGGLEAVKYLRENGIVVSAGHTDATYDDICEAFKAGVSLIGHLWNGMRGIHQREPGVVGASLGSDVAVELIADLHHIHPAILKLTYRLKGPEGIALISDSIKPAGLPEGEHVFDGRIYIVQDGLVKLPSGVIAGSSIGLDDAVRNMVNHIGVSLPEAVQMASSTPARVLGLDSKGCLHPRFDADLVVLDDSLEVVETIVEGKTMYRRGEP